MTFFLCAIAAGGGIGGGGPLLPLFILLLAFTPHDASPLTNVTVLGGAIANLAFYYNRQHPSGRKPLISYEVALMMEPMTMVGALAGVLLNKIFPGWLITVLLVIILGITTKRTLTKGLSLWRKESVALNSPMPSLAYCRKPIRIGSARRWRRASSCQRRPAEIAPASWPLRS